MMAVPVLRLFRRIVFGKIQCRHFCLIDGRLGITLRSCPFFFLLLFSLKPVFAVLPAVSSRLPVRLSHFPDAVHAVIWRNWGLVPTECLAEILETHPEKVIEIATSMGLPRSMPVSPQMHKRGFLTIIRRNWHLLPYEQLIQLLKWTSEDLAFALREDDGLFIKLGSMKPQCQQVRYREPSADIRRRAAEIKQIVQLNFGDCINEPGEPRFEFVTALSRVNNSRIVEDATKEKAAPKPAGATEKPRFIYSYFALFGDPLSDPELDPYPPGLLQRLQAQGVNGIWLHVVLRQLAPGGPQFPEWGEGHMRRLANLRKLVERAEQFGIKVYLYMNEPRAMPTAFFANRPDMSGVREDDHTALCTSDLRVRNWLSDALAFVFREVSGLGGILTITASENLTNCASHGHQTDCPRCRHRSKAEIIAEVNAAMEKGVHRSAPRANVIVWDWGWQPWVRSSDPMTKDVAGRPSGDATQILAKLPASVWVMSVSEWSLPIERGGIKSLVGEYAMSAVGPGPRAAHLWQLAKQHGMKTVAKVQLNATWELSSVPYLPVMDLVADHCSRLAQADTDGMMLSWSVGGYPSPNLELAHQFLQNPKPNGEKSLHELAERHFGERAAPRVRQAWTKFSRAFQEFPFHIQVVYRGPQQLGPANLLYAAPTGFPAGVVISPYDDLRSWCGPYSPEVLGTQFAKVADGWAEGLADLEAAQALVPIQLQREAAADLRIAQAAQIHFASSGHQAQLILTRDEFLAASSADEKSRLRKQLTSLLDREIELARRLYRLCLADSRLGYEASNHYYYVPLDLVEKVVNCTQLREHYQAAK